MLIQNGNGKESA